MYIMAAQYLFVHLIIFFLTFVGELTRYATFENRRTLLIEMRPLCPKGIFVNFDEIKRLGKPLIPYMNLNNIYEGKLQCLQTGMLYIRNKRVRDRISIIPPLHGTYGMVLGNFNHLCVCLVFKRQLELRSKVYYLSQSSVLLLLK